jgi:hypothetical protein
MINLSKSKKVTKPKKNTQNRKWTLCFHNIESTGYDIAKIEEILHTIPSIVYYCIGKEIGNETKRIHIHAFFYARNPVKFSTLRNAKFPDAQLEIEESKGTAAENRDYCFKEGKWANDPKVDQRLDDPNARVEWGEIPVLKAGKRSDLEILVGLIRNGLSDAEIIAYNPNYMNMLSHIAKTRLAIRSEEVKDQWREIHTIYCYGATATGKTRHYMEEDGYSNCYRITNYKPQSIWDGYNMQDTVIWDEFRSQISISSMLVYLEGYPNYTLSARYSGKVAMYHKCVLISNIPLEDQYTDIQRESPETWKAFLRRIDRVEYYKSKDEIIVYNSVDDYLRRNEEFHSATKSTPFDNDIEFSQQKMPFDD